MVKVRDPKIFQILDSITTILRNEMNEQNRLIRSIRSESREGNPLSRTH